MITKTVLLIDGDASSDQSLETFLEVSGFRVCLASEGSATLQSAADERPDIIVFGFKTPEDAAVLPILRRIPSLAATPIVCVTSLDEAAFRRAVSDPSMVQSILPRSPKFEGLLTAMARLLMAVTPQASGPEVPTEPSAAAIPSPSPAPLVGPQSSGSAEAPLAPISARIVAFSIDCGLFFLAYILGLFLLFPPASWLINSYGNVLLGACTVGFLLYQTILSCEGRSTLGKWLLGMRIVGPEGQPLTQGQAAARACGYVVSSVMCLGFIWSLFNRRRRCWHDLPLGSVVVMGRPLPEDVVMPMRAVAAVCLVLFGLSWMWRAVWSPRFYQSMTVHYAEDGLQVMAYMQLVHREKLGTFASDLPHLASVTAEPERFEKTAKNLFDSKAGIRFETSPNGRSFRITAMALDSRHTQVSIVGPTKVE